VKYSIRKGKPADATEIEALLPRLSDFEVPEHRIPEHLWIGDRSMVRKWAKGDRPDVDVAVAVNSSDHVIGIDSIDEGNGIDGGKTWCKVHKLACLFCQFSCENLVRKARLPRRIDAVLQTNRIVWKFFSQQSIHLEETYLNADKRKNGCKTCNEGRLRTFGCTG